MDAATTYTSRRIALRPAACAAALDSLELTQRPLTLRAENATLRLRSVSRPAVTKPYDPLRLVRGTVVVGLRTFTVQLEVLPWSATHSELGLRFTGPAWLGSPTATTRAAARTALDALAARLTAGALRSA